MKKSISKMITIFMVFILLIQLSATVFAATPVVEQDWTPVEQVIEESPSNNRASIVFPDVYDNGGIALTLKHTLTANGVKNSLLLNSAKTITRANLPSDAKKIYITGMLTHSGFAQGTGDVIRTGLCYYSEEKEYYIGEYYDHIPSATNFTEILCNVTGLNRQVTYYPYIKNLEPSYGTVSGSVGFYYSKV